MAQVEFQYNSISTIIQCNEDQKMSEICNNFTSKSNLDENNLNFIYNGIAGKQFDKNLTFNQMANSLDKARKKMNILVISNTIVDNNDKLAKNVENLNKEMIKKDQEIQKLGQEYQMQKQNIEHLIEENEKQNQNIDDLEERIEALEKDCDDMKYIISRIQFRDLSKNFLKCFNPYLLDDDFQKIKDNKQLRGEIISNRLKTLFPNADKKKMKVGRPRSDRVAEW